MNFLLYIAEFFAEAEEYEGVLAKVNSNARKGFGWKSEKPEFQIIWARKCGRKNIEIKKGGTK